MIPNSASWLKDRGSYRPYLSERLEQARVGELSCDRDDIKMQSRNSDWDQPSPVKVSNGETGSSSQRISASVVGPGAREELRRILASSDHESSIEERIRSLERENVHMLLEVWRLKLEFARAKRELQSELFRLKMDRILDKFKL